MCNHLFCIICMEMFHFCRFVIFFPDGQEGLSRLRIAESSSDLLLKNGMTSPLKSSKLLSLSGSLQIKVTVSVALVNNLLCS